MGWSEGCILSPETVHNAWFKSLPSTHFFSQKHADTHKHASSFFYFLMAATAEPKNTYSRLCRASSLEVWLLCAVPGGRRTRRSGAHHTGALRSGLAFAVMIPPLRTGPAGWNRWFSKLLPAPTPSSLGEVRSPRNHDLAPRWLLSRRWLPSMVSEVPTDSLAIVRGLLGEAGTPLSVVRFMLI